METRELSGEENTMIKFVAGNEEHMLVGFGITDGNVELLKKGRPIKVSLKDLNIPENTPPSRISVLLFYGKTESDIEKELKEFISPETVVRDERGD